MVEAPEVRNRHSAILDGRNGSASQPAVTNTLLVTKVPPSLLHSAITPSLRDFFARYGHIEAWVPLTTFERVVVVYSDEEAAEQAKLGMDYTLVEGFGPEPSTSTNRADSRRSRDGTTILRVYRGLPTPLDMVRNRRFRQHLPVPDSDKNFLISPPGSPPVGWEQIREDPPNIDTLAEDLARALQSLTTSDDNDDDMGASTDTNNHSEAGRIYGEDSLRDTGSPALCSSPRLASPRDTLIIPHMRTPSGNLPSVLVSNIDFDDDASSSRTGTAGLSIAQAFSIQRGRQAPGPISNVKATVESMQGGFQFPPSSAPRIDRTPRPPIAY